MEFPPFQIQGPVLEIYKDGQAYETSANPCGQVIVYTSKGPHNVVFLVAY